MSDTTKIRVTDAGDGVRLITLDNPPVNALGYATSAELVPAVEAADKDASVTAVVFTGANGMFSGGADVNDFSIPPTAESKTVRDVIEAIERSDKTFVAAIDGNALGGGFELALACDYRVATSKSRVGLPEIKLGLLPGAGGTEGLRRLTGATDALKMMFRAKRVKRPTRSPRRSSTRSLTAMSSRPPRSTPASRSAASRSARPSSASPTSGSSRRRSWLRKRT